MMVAGTRHNAQWALNAYDTVLYGGDKLLKNVANDLIQVGIKGIAEHLPGIEEVFGDHVPHVKGFHLLEKLDPWRQKKQHYYEDIAKDEHVDVLFGHSRGGAMIADMKVPGVQKVGLDAAMLLAHDTGELNINEGGGVNPLGLFDTAIGLTGKQNVHHDESKLSPHKVWKT